MFLFLFISSLLFMVWGGEVGKEEKDEEEEEEEEEERDSEKSTEALRKYLLPLPLHLQ